MKLTVFFTISFLPLVLISARSQSLDSVPKETENMQTRINFERLKIRNQQTDSVYYNNYPDALEKADSLMNDFLLKSIRRTPTITSTNNEDIFTWSELGPANLGGRTRAVALKRQSANQLVAWAGGVSGGLWKNENILNENSRWVLMKDSYMFVSCLDVQPGTSLKICYGTGELAMHPASRGNGVFVYGEKTGQHENISPGKNTAYSQDAGSSDDFWFINKVRYLDDGTLFVATWRGLYRLSPNSFHWNKIPDFDDDAIIDFESDRNQSIYLVAYNEVWKSSDAGTTWHFLNRKPGFPRHNFDKVELAISESSPNQVYAILATSHDVVEVIKSSDSGEHWQTCAIPPDEELNAENKAFTNGQAWYSLALAVNPANPNEVYAGGLNLTKSMDGGNSWKQFSYWNNSTIRNCYAPVPIPSQFQYVHADHHTIIFDGGDVALFANDGGVFLSENARSQSPVLKERNNGYNVSQLYTISAHPTQPVFLAGTQDNGTRVFRSDQLSNSDMANEAWDGGYCYISQSNPNVMIASYIGNQYYVSTNGGQTYSCMFSPDQDAIFPNPTAFDESNSLLYSSASGRSIFAWKDFRSTPNYRIRIDQLLPGGLTQTDKISVLKLSPNNNNVLYVGTMEGQILRISGLNQIQPQVKKISQRTWGQAYISAIDVELGKEDHIVVSLSSYGSQGVWETIISQSATPLWNDISGNLLKVPVRTIVIAPAGSRLKIIVGTEIGVFSTTKSDGASTVWDNNSLNLGKPRVDMLVYRPSDRMLLAATHGRGLFSTKIATRTLPTFATNAFKILNIVNSLKAEAKSDVSYNALQNELIINAKNGHGVQIEELNSEVLISVPDSANVHLNLDALKPGDYKIKINAPDGKLIDSKRIKIQNLNEL